MMSQVRLDRSPAATVAAAARAAARARGAWEGAGIDARLAVVRGLRHELAARGRELAATVRHPQRRSIAETLAAEIVPLADACRFLEREAPRLLRPRRPGRRGRPAWLVGSDVEIRRRPLGTVLIIGPSNYPLFLPGVQALQALVAGNAVLLKPGSGGADAALALREALMRAGLDGDLLAVLDEPPAAAAAAIDTGVDHVVLTGSSATGRAVLGRLAPRLTPATMELGGCDAVLVRRDADLALVARALRFGLLFNGGATCIAPRRVFVPRQLRDPLIALLRAELAGAAEISLALDDSVRLGRMVDAAVAAGAGIVVGARPRGSRVVPLVLANATPGMAIAGSALFAPVSALIDVDDDEHAVRLADRSPYALGASVFGAPAPAAALARRLRAGVVTVNDLIVPTADPRIPFGGTGDSGFGVTRGAEGLLALTTTATIAVRRGRWRPHLEGRCGDEESFLAGYLALAHERSWIRRLRGLRTMIRARDARRQGDRR